MATHKALFVFVLLCSLYITCLAKDLSVSEECKGTEETEDVCLLHILNASPTQYAVGGLAAACKVNFIGYVIFLARKL